MLHTGVLSGTGAFVKILPTILSGISLSLGLLQAATPGLEHLNTLREQAGLRPLTVNTVLQHAAEDHSHYLTLNRASGHRERADKEGYTGTKPSERALAAGYDSIAVAENVSWGQKDIDSSIDKLFAGIYHRFAFLSLEKDTIGIGVEAKHYTFDLGNSFLNRLCREHTYTSGMYYYNACRDGDKKIEVAAYNEARDHYKHTTSAPDIVTWPARGSEGVLPGFYAENPDPLPDFGVSGYPVSIEFNDAVYPEVPEDIHVSLADHDGNELDGFLMDKAGDPHGHLTDHQFAFFPQEHLEWGERYRVTLDVDGQSRDWCFATRSLASFGAQKVYRIDQSDDQELEIVSGRTYAFYYVPQGPEDKFNRFHYKYNTEKPAVSFIDRNTLLVTVTGEIGQRVKLRVNNGSAQTLTLIIAEDDQAEAPMAESCPVETVETLSADSAPQTRSVESDTDTDESYSNTQSAGVTADAAGGFPSVLFWLAGLLMMVRLQRSEARR